MSVVAAVVKDGNLHLASDRYVGTGDWYTLLEQPKYVIHNNLIMACAGPMVVLNKIQYELEPIPPGGNFLWRLTKEIKTLIDSDDEYEILMFSNGVLGTTSQHGELITSTYTAIGSGGYYALGTMSYLLGTDMESLPLRIAYYGAKSAVDLSPSCQEPIDTIVFKADGTYFKPSRYKDIAYTQ